MPTTLFEHDYRTIAADFADGVLKLSINRAENLNAINYYVLEEFLDALGHAARLDEVRVVALAGVGDRAFSSGDDLRDFARPEGAGPGPEPGYSRTPHQVLEMTVSQLPKPVVALLKGYCLEPASTWPWPATSGWPPTTWPWVTSGRCAPSQPWWAPRGSCPAS